jgi:hypothetical protein
MKLQNISRTALLVGRICILFAFVTCIFQINQLSGSLRIALRAGQEDFLLNDTSNLGWVTVVRSQNDLKSTLQRRRNYHSWGDEGIELDPILDFINNSYHKPDPGWNHKLYGPFVGFVAMHNGSRPTLWFAKNVLKRRHSVDIPKRLRSLFPHFQRALRFQLFDDSEQYAALIDVLKRVGSFPVIMDLSDFLGCNKDNYNMSLQGTYAAKSVPTLTLCRHVNCQYAFPMPAFELYGLATLPENNTWDAIFSKWASTFPAMEDKIPKTFWRGSCTQQRYHRKKMMKIVKQVVDGDHLDFGFTNPCPGDTDQVNLTPSEESMRYRAVLDIDGNSFSGRFSKLLCYNSVVIRLEIQDDYEEYFMADLAPGVHYLPASLENFTEVAKWAVQNSSLSEVKQIVQNANTWCKRKVHTDELHRDFLALLNGYMQGLTTADPNWANRWSDLQDAFLGTEQFQLHGGFISELLGLPKVVLRPTPEMQGLVVTKMAQMTDTL